MEARVSDGGVGMERRKVVGQLQVYSRKAREELMQIGEFFFKREGAGEVFREVYSCVDELIKNAVKANYKYVLIMERLESRLRSDPALTDADVRSQIDVIRRDRFRYEEEAESILEEERISDSVREILNQEAVHIRVKNKAYEKKREYTEEEIAQLKDLSKLNSMRQDIVNRDIKIIVKFEDDGEFFFIEVTNTSPILASDLRRIHEKRDEFRMYREENRQHEFFLNNLDTSESGFGLGYATIDSYLGDIGLNPYLAVQIIAASDTTVILSLPKEILRAPRAS